MKAFVILPILNEEESLEQLCTQLVALLHSIGIEGVIVAVDDGSTDQSFSVLQGLESKIPIVILRHASNQGPGAAFRTGFDYVLDRADGKDIILTMDADNTHSQKTVSMILSKIGEGYEVVVASVFAPGGMLIGVPFLRYVLTIGCNTIYRIFFPVKGLFDYTGFYRGYSVGALIQARQALGGQLFFSNGFASMAELLIRLRSVPMFISEVPMIVRYDYKKGKSKLRTVETIFEHLKVIRGNMFKRRVI